MPVDRALGSWLGAPCVRCAYAQEGAHARGVSRNDVNSFHHQIYNAGARMQYGEAPPEDATCARELPTASRGSALA